MDENNNGMRRLFIMRKDLHLSAGKLGSQLMHCAEAYWTNWLKANTDLDGHVDGYIDKDIFDNYINSTFTKTVCEARNKTHLLKAVDKAKELGLEENKDFGCIYDCCYTELTPEEENGTTLTGIWFKPLPDDIAHQISKKYQLYKG